MRSWTRGSGLGGTEAYFSRSTERRGSNASFWKSSSCRWPISWLEVGSSSKEGDKNGFEIQKSRRDRVLEEESKKAHLRDINIDNKGPHLECEMGQNPFPSRGASEGQCPLRLRVQNIGSKGGNAKDNIWAKRKGSDTSKMKGTANHSCGESQASEATAVNEGGCQELISTQSIGGSGEKKIQSGN